MKTRMLVFALATALMGLIAFSAGALAAKPPGAGNGGDGTADPPDLGDLIILYRDEYGVPILTVDGCQQPIAAGPFDGCETTPDGKCLVPVDPVTCAVGAGFDSYTQEVDFGRINEARSPDDVFEAQLEDVVVKLATADCISLDPAGRLVASTVLTGEEEDQVLTSAIDSPLQNLAIYRQLLMTGYLGSESAPLVLPGITLDMAARALGAAADKTGEANVDLVAYLNQIMGLTETGVTTVLGPPICIDVKEEVMGVVQMVEKCFLDYGSYGYDRMANFASLPDPAYIPTEDPEPGVFEYLTEVLPLTDPVTFYIDQDLITTAAFADEPGYLEGNIGGFAQAVDDTRAVIEFMHSHPIPLDYATELVCEASGETGYDLSISDVSGLQVPARMVAGTEGREFTVAITNLGPDTAEGTVTVTAVTPDNVSIPGFPREYLFSDLAGGENESWTESFVIDLGYATTVTWTATIVAEFDVNPGNNSVSASTVVKVTSGGGHP